MSQEMCEAEALHSCAATSQIAPVYVPYRVSSSGVPW